MQRLRTHPVSFLISLHISNIFYKMITDPPHQHQPLTDFYEPIQTDTRVPNSEENMELPAKNRIFPCKTLITEMERDRPYPTTTIDVAFGKGLMATQDCPVGTVLEKFEGQVLEYSQLGSDDTPVVLNFLQDGQWKWLLASTPAIHVNHHCSPNATVNDRQEVVAIRPLKKGDEVGYIYNIGTEDDKWDPMWTFECQCGAEKCQGLVNAYRSWDPEY